MRCPHCENRIRLEVKIDLEDMVDYVWTMLLKEGLAADQDDVEAAVDYTLQYLKDSSYLGKELAE